MWLRRHGKSDVNSVARLPEDGGGVLGDRFVRCHDRHAVQDCLRHEAAVEGVVVEGRETGVVGGCGLVEGQRFQAQPFTAAGDVPVRGQWQRQTADPVLDRNLPGRERAQIDGVPRIAAGGQGRARELRVRRRQPEEGAGVGEELHYSPPMPRRRLRTPPNGRASSSGSGSKKLSGTVIPRSMPMGRCSAGVACIGRISAIGTLRRQSVMVSPDSTRAR